MVSKPFGDFSLLWLLQSLDGLFDFENCIHAIQITRFVGPGFLPVRQDASLDSFSNLPLFQIPPNPTDVVIAGGEVGMVENFLLERNGGLDAADHELTEGALHTGDGNLAGSTGDDEFGDHRIVIGGHGVAGIDVGIDAHTLAAGSIPKLDGAGAGSEVIVGIFCIDAALDSVATRLGAQNVAGKWFASSDADLLFDQLAAHDLLGDRMLDLDPGVHFHEIEILRLFIDEVFDGASILIVDRLDQSYGSIAHALAEFRSEKWRWAFLDDFLVAALHGAIALAKVDEVAVRIRDDLELDVMRVEHEFFQIAFAISEAGDCLIGCCAEERNKFAFIKARTHATTTATSSGLDHDWKTDALRFFERGLGIDHDFCPGSDGHAIRNRGGAGSGLVSHHRNHGGGWTDKGDAGSLTDFREAGIFRKETIAGMDGIGVSDLGGGDDAIRLEIRFLARARADADRVVGELDMHRIDIGFRVNGNGFDFEFAAGADDAEGDFTPVGNQNAFEHLMDRGWRIVEKGASLDAEEHIAVLNGSGIFGDKSTDGAGFLGLDFIHHLHGLNDAERLAFGNGGADIDEIRRVRCGFAVESADHWRSDFCAFGCGCCCGSRGGVACGGWRCGGGSRSGRQAGEQATKIIKIRAFLELEVEVLLGEIKEGEPVLVHEFDNAADFLEVHGEKRFGVEWASVPSEAFVSGGG